MIAVHVAVGVVYNDKQEILVAKRPPGKPYAGYWEFPGGKVEAGENVQQALSRELQEEVNICPEVFEPLMQIEQQLDDKIFLLDTWLVKQFSGELNANEAQQLAWVKTCDLVHLVFPPANEAIIKKLLSINL